MAGRTVRVQMVLTASDGEGTTYRTGQQAEVDQATAKTWMANGVAEPVTEQNSAHRKRQATREPARSAVQPGPVSATPPDDGEDEAPAGAHARRGETEE